MPKHSGCWICGSTDDQELISVPVPGLAKGTSVALCQNCLHLPRPDLYQKVKQIQTAMEDSMKKAREAVARG